MMQQQPTHQPKSDVHATLRSPQIDPEAERIAAFGRAIEALRREIEPQLGEADAEHIRRIGKLSRQLEVVGRGLIYLSFEPVGIGVGTTALCANKAHELMENNNLKLNEEYDDGA
jgi:linoleoyl-CoA desaturase